MMPAKAPSMVNVFDWTSGWVLAWRHLSCGQGSLCKFGLPPRFGPVRWRSPERHIPHPRDSADGVCHRRSTCCRFGYHARMQSPWKAVDYTDRLLRGINLPGQPKWICSRWNVVGYQKVRSAPEGEPARYRKTARQRTLPRAHYGNLVRRLPGDTGAIGVHRRNNRAGGPRHGGN